MKNKNKVDQDQIKDLEDKHKTKKMKEGIKKEKDFDDLLEKKREKLNLKK